MSDDQEQESTVSIIHSEAPEGWEINTMMIRAESKEEMEAVLEYIKQRYQPSIFTISHIPQRDRKYLHSIVMYNLPLIDLMPDKNE